MAWTIEYETAARRQLRKLDRNASRRIIDFLDARLGLSENPRKLGDALSGPLGQLWRYRVGDYRILCDIQDQRLVVLVVKIGHRGDVYR